MPSPPNPYASHYETQEDGTVTFRCSSDLEANPWLALPPHHAVVIQTQAFWTAIGATIMLGGMEAGQWSALTWIDWELGAGDGGHAVRGVYRGQANGEKPTYEIVLFNADDAPIVTIQGRGVVFRNRNFEKWRGGAKAEAKAKAKTGVPHSDFTFANRNALNLMPQERILVAPFEEGTSFVDALVTPENGFPPGNLMIGGSGDHVNSTHIHEIARQALILIKGRCDIDTSGAISFGRYVELGSPLRLNIAEEGDHVITFELEQLGKKCAEIMLRWKPTDQ